MERIPETYFSPAFPDPVGEYTTETAAEHDRGLSPAKNYVRSG